MKRLRVQVRGRVQGVGFRPFVWRTAHANALQGFVLNQGDGVLIEIEGQGERCDDFLKQLTQIPPPAHIAHLDIETIPPQLHPTGFIVSPSIHRTISAAISPDLGTCNSCLTELFDPTHRRYRYPFIACCHCGPRLTFARRLPYDRENTEMAAFPLCSDCLAEYENPNDRRFHAEPTACDTCGPQFNESVEQIYARLTRGEVIAIKGIGGFHLACDARNSSAVARLRHLKGRDSKPLAVMVASVAAARKIAHIDEVTAQELTSPQRPIVLVPALTRELPLSPSKADAGGTVDALASNLHPQLAHLGILLPYTPLHYLLFHEAAQRPEGTDWLTQCPPDLALVMTSANYHNEPLFTEATELASSLAVDAVIDHNRQITLGCDDSVLKMVQGQPLYLRRSRGAAPDSFEIFTGPPLLAVGAQLKVTLGFAKGTQAVLSQHIGDLENAATYRNFEHNIAHWSQLLDFTPKAIIHDLHPDFMTTRWAQTQGLPTLAVQHHHAHLAAVAAEFRSPLPLIGLVLDGYGYGEGGAHWGGELLKLDETGEMQRLGHLQPLIQIGGERAAREPWRLAVSFGAHTWSDEVIRRRWPTIPRAVELAHLTRQLVNPPTTTACGRLFDLAAGLSGITHSRFEADAAMQWEDLAQGETRILETGWQINAHTLDLTPLLKTFTPETPTRNAQYFHGTLAAALVDWVADLARAHGRQIALCGGCINNQLLTETLCTRFSAHQIRVLIPRRLPPGDGAIALGQLWVGRQRLRSLGEKSCV